MGKKTTQPPTGNIASAKDKYKKYKVTDPFTHIPPALLNDVDIKNYVDTTGMIDPFYPEQLNGITYDIKLCGKVRYWSKKESSDSNSYDKKNLIKKDLFILAPGHNETEANGLETCDRITLEPNSITYVTLEPVFRLPAYIVARFNLKIKLIYQGLLLGTGPIIDPCFQGKLSIPLHNLTENSYVLNGGDSLIAMEFTKVSPNRLWDETKVEGETSKIKNFSGSGNTEDRDVFYYTSNALKGTNYSSILNAVPSQVSDMGEKINDYNFKIKSMEEKINSNNDSLINDIDEFKSNTDKSISRLSIGTIISVAGILVALLILIFSLLIPTWQSFNAFRQERIEFSQTQQELIQQIETLNKEIEELELQLADSQNNEIELNNKISELTNQVNDLSAKLDKSNDS
ncbi:MAG: hypothetical protein NC548_31155 [Lachnospiraceae bacterium]|nr:hypothetical protein [Lachnospiraceae bacterium]